MSRVIITTMNEIPENCCDCPCVNRENGACQADKENRLSQEYRPFWCPLKEEKTQGVCCENRTDETDVYRGLYGFYDR